MTEFQRLENPTLNVSKFKKGDPVLAQAAHNTETYGFVVGKRGQSIGIWDFQTGNPFWKVIIPEYGHVKKVPLEDAIAFCQDVSQNQLGTEIAKGGFKGALAAKYQADLNALLLRLQNCNTARENYRALKGYSKSPETGVYVIRGVYSGAGPLDHFDGVVSEPGLKNNLVGKLMYRYFPEGFRDIPAEFPPVHGNLVTYWAQEVPETAIELIKNPAWLNINNQKVECYYEVSNPESTRRYSVSEKISRKTLSLLKRSN